jgi:hypothetical protein
VGSVRVRLTALVLAVCGSVGAALQWDTDRVLVQAVPNAAQAHAVFRCVNTGTMPVTIRNVRVSCGCMTTAAAGTTVAPGGESSLAVDMAIAGLSGLVSKKIWVETDDPDAALTTLTFDVEIPVFFEAGPTFLIWDLGDTATQSVDIAVRHRDPIRVTGVSARTGAFAVSLHTVEEGRRYRIDAAPLDASRACRDEIVAVMDFPPDNPFSVRISVVVRDLRRTPEPVVRRILYWLAVRAGPLSWVALAGVGGCALALLWRLVRR